MAYVHYQPNPVERNVGDCAVRAVAKALDIDWEAAYALIVANGFQMGDMPSSDAVWGSVLRQYGFYREAIGKALSSTTKEFPINNSILTATIVF